MKLSNDNEKTGNRIEKNGTIIDVLGSARFKVQIDEDNSKEGIFFSKKEYVATICGKMYQKRIKIVKGDRVKLSLIISEDNVKAIIVFRLDQ